MTTDHIHNPTTACACTIQHAGGGMEWIESCPIHAAASALAEALQAVLASTLMESRDAEGNQTHDWHTCEQRSCRLARAALERAGITW